MNQTSRTAREGATPPEWAATDERSNMLALRVMAWIAVRLGRPVARLLLHPITLYFVLFAPQQRRHSRRYLGRALGREATWRDGYRHVHAFAATVLDRVYFVRGRLQDFDLQVSDGGSIGAAAADGRGAFLLGAHLGSFEALHALGHRHPNMQVVMAMYPDNARKIHNVLHAVAPNFKLSVIAIGRPGSTLQIRDALDAGGVVGLLGDRILGPDQGPQTRHTSHANRHGSTGSTLLPFLGQPARFVDGPFRLAMLLRRRVIFMVGIYRGGRRYELRFEPLADFSQPCADAAERERHIQQALADYVARLEALCREVPYNWFNFFDFWREDEPA